MLRTKTRSEAQGALTFRQGSFTGFSLDQPASELPDGYLAYLENAVAYGNRLEPLPGTALYSSAGLPSTTDPKRIFFHRKSKVFLYINGTDLYYAVPGSNPNAMVWTAMTRYLPSDVLSTQMRVIREFGSDALIFGEGVLFHVNLTDLKWRIRSAPFYGHVAGGGSGDYKYRYLFTFCRITGGSDRLSGTLESEGCPVETFGDIADYTEWQTTSPIDIGAAHNFSLANASAQNLAACQSSDTHVAMYRTLNIGSGGIDPLTGEANNSELYVWVKDMPIVSYDFSDPAQSVSDDVPDDTLRARIASGDYLLKTRFFTVLPVSPDVGVVGNGFVVSAAPNSPETLVYGQTIHPQHVGFYNPAFQTKKLDDRINAIQIYRDSMVILQNNRTTGCNMLAQTNAGSLESIFVLTNFYPADESLGVVDWGSIADIEGGAFVTRCSDGTIRVWDGTKFGPDLADRLVSSIVRKMVEGSAAAYANGAYLIFYRDDSSATSNTKALRLALKPQAGEGWTICTGLPAAPLRIGGITVIDHNNLQRLLVIDKADNKLYWTETFDGFTGSSLSRATQFKTGGTPVDITSTVRFRELTGEEESHNCFHQESHFYFRPKSSSYLSGFEVDMLGYASGTLVDTAEAVPYAGDCQFWRPIEGPRIQVGFSTNKAGWVLAGMDTHYLSQDRKNFTSGPDGTGEATYQAELSQNLIYWLSRGRYPDFDRVNAVRGLPTGQLLSATVTGPDGRANSAFVVGNPAYLAPNYVLPEQTLNDAFTFMFWTKNPIYNYVLESDDSAYVERFGVSFDNATTLEIFSSAMTTINATIANVADGTWHHFVIKRTGGTLKVFQNGVERASVARATVFTAHRIYLGVNNQTIFDLRWYDAHLSDGACEYYRNDVLNNAGEKVLPLF